MFGVIFKTHIISSKEIKEMPIVSIKIAKGRPVDIKRNLVKSVTKAVASSLELSPELVTVLIEEIERENWSTGGELHSDKYGGGYGHK
jgi:4-oxalocrotonate tautomerase